MEVIVCFISRDSENGTTVEIMSSNVTFYGNSVLYQFPISEIVLQPYWIFILQVLCVQVCLRIYNRCRHKTFLLFVEASLIHSDPSKMIKEDMFDCILLLSFLAQLIWYAVQQPKCMSYPLATN